MIENPEKASPGLDGAALQILHTHLASRLPDHQKAPASALLLINPSRRDIRQLTREAKQWPSTFGHEFTGLRGMVLRDANNVEMRLFWPSFLWIHVQVENAAQAAFPNFKKVYELKFHAAQGTFAPSQWTDLQQWLEK